MKVLFLTTNPNALVVSDWIKSQGDEVVVSQEKLTLDFAQEVSPDFFVVYNYRYMVSEEIINKWPNRFVNLHISFLPWNRGAYPIFWSLAENTPKGVSIHLMDKGMDSGDILVQKEFQINEAEHTLATLYDLFHSELQQLFKNSWGDIKNEQFRPQKQFPEGTLHPADDFWSIQHIFDPEGWDISVAELKNRYQSYLIGQKEHERSKC